MLKPAHPQYATELHCKIIFVKLLGEILEFHHAPKIDSATAKILQEHYLGKPIVPGTYRDALLLEPLDYRKFLREIGRPVHGYSQFHIGHLNPKARWRHIPENVFWRTSRSNLIQGDMTLREARIYIIKLIARYFELGELSI